MRNTAPVAGHRPSVQVHEGEPGIGWSRPFRNGHDHKGHAGEGNVGRQPAMKHPPGVMNV